MTPNEIVGKRIKLLREEAKLNQNQIASFLSVDQSFISKCEKGERQFTVDMLEKMCSLFGCSMIDLLGENEPIKTLSFAFRADTINADDLQAIADINKIALNIGQLRNLLEA